MKKLRLTLIAVFILALSASSCTHRLCPTYAKQDIKKDITVKRNS